MMGDLQVHLPTLCWVLSSFWPKTARPLCPILPIHQISPQLTFFCLFPPDEKKILKGKRLADVEEMKQKTAEARKDTKINKFKNYFEQWKIHLDTCIPSNVEYFESDWSLNM